MSIGERITSLRKERNISQSQLAQMLDVTRQAVSKWENDLTAPDTIKLIQLADALDIDVEYLATGRHHAVQSVPNTITVEKPVEVVVERIVEKPVIVRERVEVEKPVIKKVYRTRLVRNYTEYLLIGCISFIVGILIGMLL